ncbi:MAG TPA: hypothetical protein VKW04_16045 [Planctomycetota bacterium]|jgi:hypothetical protein|nr:hypothetical protein [Planctomycetota bacterium]
MRPSWPLLWVCIASCAGPAPSQDPEIPAALSLRLNHPDPACREEAVAGISIRGQTVQEALGGTWPARVEQDTASLRTAIRDALAEPSPERMIRHAYHSLRTGCLARDARRVSAALAAQGFVRIEIYEPHDGLKFTRYLAQPWAYTNSAGDRHDLFCWTQAVRRQDSSWLVREIYVGLHVGFDAPFKTVAAIERYPRGSVLDRFLDLPELQKVVLVFPLLEELEFTYGRIRTKESEAAPAGFHVTAGFVLEGKAGGTLVSYTAECGLDPRESRGGRLERAGFVPSDLVGPLMLRGSGIWGAGGLKPTEDY